MNRRVTGVVSGWGGIAGAEGVLVLVVEGVEGARARAGIGWEVRSSGMKSSSRSSVGGSSTRSGRNGNDSSRGRLGPSTGRWLGRYK